MAFVSNGWLALAFTPLAALAAMSAPALQSIMSRQSAADAQGELQGILTSVNALALIVSPLLMTSVFAAATADGTPIYLPGAPFLMSLVLAGTGLLLFLTCRSAWQRQPIS